MKDKIRRIIFLVEQLNKYNDYYYNKNESLVTDKQYDDLFDELKSLENECNYRLSNSPTNNVGCEVKSDLVKVKHSHLLMSLDKTKSVDDLIKFANGKECILSLKMDGLTCLLTYDNGDLFRAETRGDAEYGEDVTHNARVFDNIPLAVPVKDVMEFEGESIITYNDFHKINDAIHNECCDIQVKDNLSMDEFNALLDKRLYKNPRNLASGSVRQFDSSVAKDRHLRFVVWKLPNGFDKFSEGLDYANSLGFEVVPYKVLPAGFKKDELEYEIDYLKNIANLFSYPIDGLVMTYNDVAYGKSLGTTGRFPKHSIAFKFDDEKHETILRDIDWTMGKTGVLTPTAIFDPVYIDGTKVERASLHNISVMNDLHYIKDWHSGLVVEVYKANQIIPQISSVKSNGVFDGNKLSIPDKCPICGAKTVIHITNKSEVLICNNPNCGGKLLGRLSHFVSRDAMDIIGLSEAALSTIISIFNINWFSDLYRIKINEPLINRWMSMNGYGKDSVNKILNAIENSKVTTLDRLINAMSIDKVGLAKAKDIARFCEYDIDTFKKYASTKPEAFKKIDGIGQNIVDSIRDWVDSEWIQFLGLCSILTFKKPDATNEKFKGMIFCATGSFNNVSRSDIKKIVESNGGKMTSSVSSATNYLITNDKNSGSKKNENARRFGTKIIDEDEFINLVTNTK